MVYVNREGRLSPWIIGGGGHLEYPDADIGARDVVWFLQPSH